MSVFPGVPAVRVAAAGDGSGDGSVTATTSLNSYLREQCGLSGTKVMCGGGMCGACVVTARIPDPATGQTEVRAVNSCLAPLYNCQGWQVETVQHIGDRRTATTRPSPGWPRWTAHSAATAVPAWSCPCTGQTPLSLASCVIVRRNSIIFTELIVIMFWGD